MALPTPDGGGHSVVLDATEADRVRNRFDDLAAEFDNTRGPLKAAYTAMTAACGELAPAIEEGAAMFLLSWNDVFDVCSTEAALIAGNINNLRVDLEALDRDARTSITL